MSLSAEVWPNEFGICPKVLKVLISGGWNRRGIPLCAEVSSLQGVGIEEFHCIQRCPHFRELE